MNNALSIISFLEQAQTVPVIDVRSPGEFEKGHIPGAINMPLFTNEERAIVGTLYKQTGRDEAIEKGLEIVGPKMADFVRTAKGIAKDKQLLVHCWRGGMRSGSMTWLLNTAGLQVATLKGGYKSYRNFVLEQFLKQYPIVVLSGDTGSGKTEILYELHKMGQQIIDLEGLAQHQGSAFGSLGTLQQPTQEQFENDLANQLYSLDVAKSIWVEDESITIGKCVIPKAFWEQMRQVIVLKLVLPLEERVRFLVEGYSTLATDFLQNSIERISKKLGGEQAKEAAIALQQKDYATVVRIVLKYYDKAYAMGETKRVKESITEIKLDTIDAQLNARIISNLKINHRV